MSFNPHFLHLLTIKLISVSEHFLLHIFILMSILSLFHHLSFCLSSLLHFFWSHLLTSFHFIRILVMSSFFNFLGMFLSSFVIIYLLMMFSFLLLSLFARIIVFIFFHLDIIIRWWITIWALVFDFFNLFFILFSNGKFFLHFFSNLRNLISIKRSTSDHDLGNWNWSSWSRN